MLLACSRLPSPSAARFLSIWSSSSLRSIISSTVGLSAPGARKSRSAALIMVKVLPLPWVCQMRPRVRLGSSARLTAASTAPVWC
ncbi:hypothetical protein GALL_506350 [mine drainage metagenome]|uniref:Uncharacterized protein n=1 Tax=mine drainage metagenome TaxID=410659 RepID=A0A1J5PAN5_9ZZZZ